MIYLMVRNNTGGYHGHQLKDILSGITIAKMFGFTYVHNSNPYLEFFGLGEGELTIKDLPRTVEKIVISGPKWAGLNYSEAIRLFGYFNTLFRRKNCLIIVEKSLRMNPCSAIRWYAQGLIRRNIFEEIVRETSKKFMTKHIGRRNYFNKKNKIYVAMHINRGVDYDRKRFPKHFSTSHYPRYMFPMAYYRRIVKLLKMVLRNREYEIHIYTEKLNSQEIVRTFYNRKNIILHLGDNRDQRNHRQIYDIFYHFVVSDILVACNSSFSAMACYFKHQGIAIYHPHMHLFDLPQDRYIPTDVDGNFDINGLFFCLRKRKFFT